MLSYFNIEKYAKKLVISKYSYRYSYFIFSDINHVLKFSNELTDSAVEILRTEQQYDISSSVLFT